MTRKGLVSKTSTPHRRHPVAIDLRPLAGGSVRVFSIALRSSRYVDHERSPSALPISTPLKFNVEKFRPIATSVGVWMRQLSAKAETAVQVLCFII